MKEADQNIEKACAAFVDEYGTLGQALLKRTQNNLEEARCAIEDRYQGEYEWIGDFALAYLKSQSDSNDVLLCSINFERFVYCLRRGLFPRGAFFEIHLDGRVHVFSQDDRVSPLTRVYKNSRKARAFIAKHGKLGQALLGQTRYVLEEAHCLIEDRYQGRYGSTEDFVRHYVSNWALIPDDLRRYILCNGYLEQYLFTFKDAPFFALTVEDQVHVFSREQEAHQ
ncbi:hypothetical protein CAGGBEG34_30043 [Candidatus Glomeribacter gigasporarum BEG34]|uniref:Uncharacterized protein n=1 Tax=Candidatus Glomeribacter gigasporarum BEG34 TaxID=1070319 RepID=G2JBC5_9BURK|nr:hypothetical protein [Candidatus Glomeribacter gigasporarum]CCD30079.1 hypothetical protein CAGGBEG34_30043 [Candidatus Glomeribacter gigasporarum BEG34]